MRVGGALAAALLAALPAAAWADLLEGEGATRLPQTVSASGARYSDGEQSFWVKGDRATWQMGQAPARSCEPRPR